MMLFMATKQHDRSTDPVRPFFPLYLVIIMGLILIFMASVRPAEALAKAREITLIGKTMGTTYRVKVITVSVIDKVRLKNKIDDRLKRINRSMSTYDPESEISRFNTWKKTARGFAISTDFWTVMEVAQQIYDLTEGAWDGTIAPLINLWGFGSQSSKQIVPTNTAIQKLRPAIGFHLIDLNTNRQLIKKRKSVTLDLASIAKGYGVDVVARLLEALGYKRYLVEIGGETYAAGRRLDDGFWQVGINRPDRKAPFNAIYKVVPLLNRALATSGDYRNYFEVDGKYYSHILDPRTGYPVSNGIVSVSVLADSCTVADGLATGIMVMGVEKGLTLTNRLTRVETLIVVRTKDGRLENHLSKNFTMNDF